VRRVGGAVLGVPFTPQGRRDLLYCCLGGPAGVAVCAGPLLGLMLAAAAALRDSVHYTLVALALVAVAFVAGGWVGRGQRWLLAQLAGADIPALPPFRPWQRPTRELGRRLTHRDTWRAAGCQAARLPVAAGQCGIAIVAVLALTDLAYPVFWLVGEAFFVKMSIPVAVPPPVPSPLDVQNLPESLLACAGGAAGIIAVTWLARALTLADVAVVSWVLGRGRSAARIHELERTRAAAVDDAAAAVRRIERNLHDGAQMRLAALAMNLGMAQEKLGGASGPAAEEARELLDAAHRNAVAALAELRDLAKGIHPPALDAGLPTALASLAASSPIPVLVNVVPGDRPAPAIESIAYFCATESLANAVKHSYANQVTITLSTGRGVIRLSVRDDGIGGASQRDGGGLAGLAQRVSTVDGHLTLSSPPGGPTTVTIELPLST